MGYEPNTLSTAPFRSVAKSTDQRDPTGGGYGEMEKVVPSSCGADTVVSNADYGLILVVWFN